MQTVSDIFAAARGEGRVPVSFEIFPPKGDLTLEEAEPLACELGALSPDFVSVTYSAGGSMNKKATVDVASLVQERGGVPAVAHLTGIGLDRESFDEAVRSMREGGIVNVLGLRGDVPEGAQPPGPGAPFVYAKDVISALAGEGFCVGAAAYPEGHVECFDDRENVEHMKMKQDAGADFFITQLFFDNECFYRFRERAAAAGIDRSVSCGIMSFLSKAQIQRMVFLCGASLPARIVKLLARYQDDPASLRKAGIEYACEQLVDLRRNGVDGLHIYTMNHPDIAAATMAAIREAGMDA